MLGKKRVGWNCDTINPDGSRTCRRFEVNKGERFASGTEITVGVNPDTCEPVFSGDSQFMLDDDEKKIDSIARKMTSQCKKERGL